MFDMGSEKTRCSYHQIVPANARGAKSFARQHQHFAISLLKISRDLLVSESYPPCTHLERGKPWTAKSNLGKDQDA